MQNNQSAWSFFYSYWEKVLEGNEFKQLLQKIGIKSCFDSSFIHFHFKFRLQVLKIGLVVPSASLFGRKITVL